MSEQYIEKCPVCGSTNMVQRWESRGNPMTIGGPPIPVFPLLFTTSALERLSSADPFPTLNKCSVDSSLYFPTTVLASPAAMVPSPRLVEYSPFASVDSPIAVEARPLAVV